jgi:hypothetical protein
VLKLKQGPNKVDMFTDYLDKEANYHAPGMAQVSAVRDSSDSSKGANDANGS